MFFLRQARNTIAILTPRQAESTMDIRSLSLSKTSRTHNGHWTEGNTKAILSKTSREHNGHALSQRQAGNTIVILSLRQAGQTMVMFS